MSVHIFHLLPQHKRQTNNYYFDCKFQQRERKRFLNLFGPRQTYFELISVSLVTEDGRSYYAICKETGFNDCSQETQQTVLLPIFNELIDQAYAEGFLGIHDDWSKPELFDAANYNALVGQYGKTRDQIMQELAEFLNDPLPADTTPNNHFFSGSYNAAYAFTVLRSLFFGQSSLKHSVFPCTYMDLEELREHENLYINPFNYAALEYNEDTALDAASYYRYLHRLIKKSSADRDRVEQEMFEMAIKQAMKADQTHLDEVLNEIAPLLDPYAVEKSPQDLVDAFPGILEDSELTAHADLEEIPAKPAPNDKTVRRTRKKGRSH